MAKTKTNLFYIDENHTYDIQSTNANFTKTSNMIGNKILNLINTQPKIVNRSKFLENTEHVLNQNQIENQDSETFVNPIKIMKNGQTFKAESSQHNTPFGSFKGLDLPNSFSNQNVTDNIESIFINRRTF